MGKEIKSFSIEMKIDQDLSTKRVLLEKEFYSRERRKISKIDRRKILHYAMMNETGIAKSWIVESMSCSPNDEYSLETLALVETYGLNFDRLNFWGRYLDRTFPGNLLVRSIRNVQQGREEKNWGLALKGSQKILEIDPLNTYALTTEAISYFRLGKKRRAIDSWSRIGNIRSLPEIEIALFCRTMYNLRMFEEVVNLVNLFSAHEGDYNEIAEMGIRSLYNLKRNDECVTFCKRLIQNDANNLIAIRFLSRTLMRQRKSIEAIPILEKFCEIAPNSVDAWESLIEANLVLDRENAAFSIRERMLAGPIEIEEYLLTVIEILVRFRWENEYRDLLENIKLGQIDGLEIGIAKIFLKLGNLSRSWEILKKSNSDPVNSEIGEEIKSILELTKTEVRELDDSINTGDDLWIPQLVTREILRKSKILDMPKKSRYCCHLISSSLDRGGAERQVTITMRNMSLDKIFNCSLAVHRIDNDDGRGSYFGELGPASSSIFNLQEIDLEADGFPGKEIIHENEELIDLLTGVVRDKVKRLISHFSLHNPDLVHAWQDETIFTSSLAAALTGIPRVLCSARSLNPQEKTTLHNVKSPYLRSCFREILKQDRFQLSTNSFAGRRSYSKWLDIPEDKIEVIHNGVDFNQMEKTGDSSYVRKKFRESGFIHGDFIVGGIFRLEAGKRPELWIEAFEKARSQIPRLKGVIIGGGKLEQTVRKWVKDKRLEDCLMIVGESENISGWLEEMDIFLLTSSTEGLPNVIIEAQGFGVPVVCTDAGGVSEIVSEGVTGIIVDSSEAQIIADSMVKLISGNRIPKMREEAMLESRKRFSVEQMISKTRETYSRHLSLVEVKE